MTIQLNGSTGISPSALPYLVGQICFFAMETAPAGFQVCDGGTLSRTIYAAAYSAMGTLYGAGDGVTTFNKPDLRGEFIRGADMGRGVDSGRDIGTTQTHQSNNLRDVELGLTNDGGSSGTIPEDGNYSAWTLTGDEGANPNFQHRFRLWGRETRPRNVALLPCVFVGV